MKVIRDPHTTALIKAATALELQVEDLAPTWQLDAIRISHHDHHEVVVDGREYGHLSYQSAQWADDKHISKIILEGCGVATPQHFLIELEADTSIAEQLADMEIGPAYVCKPLYGTDGHAVGMHKLDVADMEMHIDAYRDTYQYWMVEEQIAGEDLRIQVIGGKIAAACRRLPAYVVGDGEHNLEELLALYNEAIAQTNPNNRLDLDGDSRRLMREQEVYLDTIIDTDRKIQLKYISNMGQGGIAVDVSEELHPAYQDLVDQVANAFGFRTFALDGIVPDSSQHPSEGFKALEVNAKAQWMHHTFSQVRTHNIPELILRDLFPEIGQ